METQYKKSPEDPKTVHKKVTTLDDFFAYTQTTGSREQAGSNVLYGVDQSGSNNAMPISQDTQGWVFFTRPTLNLSRQNLLNNRSFHSLLTQRDASVHRYVRCTLDPSLKLATHDPVSCSLVDNKQVIIPLLTNTLQKLSGWPDVVAPVFTSKTGIRKEQWAIIDGTTEINEVFDLDATFTNIADDPIGLLFKTWINYGAYVFDGQLQPYRGTEVRNEIDYTTRIYRMVLDKTQTYVTRIACTIASFPTNDPTGKAFDYDSGAMYANQNKEINIRFKCMGAMYDDPIIVKWFNLATTYANPALRAVIAAKYKSDGSHTYEAIPNDLLTLFKYRGYPLINTETYALEWWVDTESASYKDILSGATPDYRADTTPTSVLASLAPTSSAPVTSIPTTFNA